MGRSQALANDRCPASYEAAKLRRDRTGLTGRLRCTTGARSGSLCDCTGRLLSIGQLKHAGQRFAEWWSKMASTRNEDRLGFRDDRHGNCGPVCDGVTERNPHCLLHAVSAGRLLASRRRAATVPQARWRSRGPRSHCT